MQEDNSSSYHTARFAFPPVLGLEEKIDGNVILHHLENGRSLDVLVEEFSEQKVKGYLLRPIDDTFEPVLAITNSAKAPADHPRALRMREIPIEDEATIGTEKSKARWLRHPSQALIPASPVDYEELLKQISQSWEGAFTFLEEDRSAGTGGLREPQFGAIHAVHAHWSVTNAPATVVMPTGTGKTEAMISILVSRRCERLLVVVPTDALRTQLSNKFLTLGVLKEYGIVSRSARQPVVGILKHRPKSIEAVDAFFSKCGVVVTTISIAGQCSEVIQERMAYLCPYLFIDEAHHLAASTWKSFKRKFGSSYVVQFTATPFREDGKPVEGKPIYNYPLGKAQEEGYFKQIQYRPVIEFDPHQSDKAIAEKAIEQLRADYDKGHILMARVGTIPRAEEVFLIYKQFEEFNPVRIHTGLGQSERRRIREQIINREARIVVCVDMLGEGFDLPELKIAAFHDIRKSLPVTLQLAGRFTRARSDLGDPTFIANIAQADVKEELRTLYSQDADWNLLLRQSSDDATQEEFDLWEFIEGFGRFPEELSLQNVRPAMSTVVYRTRCEEWQPTDFHIGIKGFAGLDRVYDDHNPLRSTLVVVTAKKIPVEWARIEEIYTWAWELNVLYWDKDRSLLFIHGSSNSGFYKDMARAVAGPDVELINGPQVFRCFAGVNRLRLQNVGLLEQIGRLIRYTMRAGSDVEPGLSEAQKRNTIKSNIFGAGFENGGRTTVGCSYKGRIWSRRTTNLEALTNWFDYVGTKLLDDSIDPDEILKGTLVPEMVTERPLVMPIAIDWPDVIYRESQTTFSFVFASGSILPLHEADIELVAPSEEGDLRFAIASGDANAEFTMSVTESDGIPDFQISENSGGSTQIEYGLSREPLEDYFYEHPPIIWFSDGSSLEGNSYVQLTKTYDPYPRDAIRDWDWTGVDLRKESQGLSKNETSIQYKVTQKLKQQSYNVIFDDDDSGEAADIVGVEIIGDAIRVDLYHCKYSGDKKPGARIADLYELCGQAQKSIHWMDRPCELFRHLLRREPRRTGALTGSRFEHGDKETLMKILEMCHSVRVEMRVFIVQPGLSKVQASTQQLELLSVTQNYLIETFLIPLTVIASP